VTTVVDNPTPTLIPETLEVPALVKTSLEFYREGKTYEVVVGYNIGSAFFVATPRPELPQKQSEAGAKSANLIWYSDIDNDGETEFIVSLLFCGAYCTEAIQVYEYDPADDNYYVADQFGAKFALDSCMDIDKDGNPELITGSYGFCYNCSIHTAIFSAITILRYEQGELKDVTKEFPGLIEQDAEDFLVPLKENNDPQSMGYTRLASYLYDMYRLGRLEEAQPIFDELCEAVVKPTISRTDFDCEEYRTKVETAIYEYEK
jgi:hypothetical protein